ncbi:MAG TPA: hypothetical protein VFH71_02600 [Rhodanobacteraceae bacterium]|nr:hypothetical protein [Rhodanobacteraceae bacterium]
MDPWTSAMLRGDFDAAWKVSDGVLQRRLRSGERAHHLPRHWQWLWDGRELAGLHVLVHCYHGLGDTLQFVRLLPLLRARCAAITLWLQPALLELLRTIEGADRIEPLHDGAPDVTRDADVELMELPHILRLTPQSVPARMPYLGRAFPRAPRDRTKPLRIGLCWRSGDWNHARSIPESALSPLARVRGVQWFSLQFPAHEPPFAMRDLACRDLRELARRMCTLDLVISVDTLAAHLAGALGLPTWTLLPQDCDWRWMRGRGDCPWYPTMRLLRQARAGEWADVVERVVTRLQDSGRSEPGKPEGPGRRRDDEATIHDAQRRFA